MNDRLHNNGEEFDTEDEECQAILGATVGDILYQAITDKLEQLDWDSIIHDALREAGSEVLESILEKVIEKNPWLLSGLMGGIQKKDQRG